jgi:ABC-type uncharacterized transport system permease subunit
MSLGDLFSGSWTWRQLLGDVLPLVLVAVAAFTAGYAKGWNVGVRWCETVMTKGTDA